MGVVLDISKAFDKVCDQGLASKLQCNVISENFLKLLENVLGYRKHSVVLIGHCSNWADVNSGIPQGSYFSTLFISYVTVYPKIFSQIKHYFQMAYGLHKQMGILVENQL